VIRKESDEELLIRYQNAESEAFREFFRRYRNIIYNFLLFKLKNSQDADDAVQEVFFRIHRFILSYDPGQKAMPWVFGVARHVAYDILKRKKRRAEQALDDTEVAGATNAALAFEARESLLYLLRDLSEDERGLITARFLDNETSEELAQKQGLDPATLRKRVSRLLLKIKQKSEF
jgi:RNA polymerase sigma-70 factor (ECF subfamily)